VSLGAVLVWKILSTGIGSVHKRTGDVLAYLYTWTTTFIVKPAVIAVVTLTACQYFLSGVMDSKLISNYIHL
jgi:hypothetical protein